MADLATTLMVDGKEWPVNLEQAHGSGGNFQIMIARYYYGKIVHTLQGWKVYANTDKMTEEHKKHLISVVENHVKKT